jgi:hypothetical protein
MVGILCSIVKRVTVRILNDVINLLWEALEVRVDITDFYNPSATAWSPLFIHDSLRKAGVGYPGWRISLRWLEESYYGTNWWDLGYGLVRYVDNRGGR